MVVLLVIFCWKAGIGWKGPHPGGFHSCVAQCWWEVEFQGIWAVAAKLLLVDFRAPYYQLRPCTYWGLPEFILGFPICQSVKGPIFRHALMLPCARRGASCWLISGHAEAENPCIWFRTVEKWVVRKSYWGASPFLVWSWKCHLHPLSKTPKRSAIWWFILLWNQEMVPARIFIPKKNCFDDSFMIN